MFYQQCNLHTIFFVFVSRASDTVENLCFQAANYYYKQGNMDKMMEALTQLPKFEERINFLKRNGLYHLAVDILKDDEKYLEAAKILRSQGKLEDACDLLKDSSEHSQFIAECQLGRVRKLMQVALEGDDAKMVEEMLTTALELFGETTDLSRQAEARWLLGVLKKDVELVKTAKREFTRAGNTIGEIHATDSLLSGMDLPKYNTVRAAFHHLKELFKLISILAKPKKPEEQRLAALCDEFYGVERAREGNTVKFNKHEGARVQRLLTRVVPDEADLETMRNKIIVNDLIPMVMRWVVCLRKICMDESERFEQCPEYVIGLKCSKLESCLHRHGPYRQGILLEYINNVISLLLIDDIINESRKLPNMSTFNQELSKVFDVQQQEKNCARLYRILFPPHCHPRLFSEKAAATRNLFDILQPLQRDLQLPQHEGVKRQMKWYVKSMHEASDQLDRKGDRDLDRRANTDVWLQVWIVHRLFDGNTKEMEDWVAHEEKYCNDTWKAKKPPLGMLSIPGSAKPTGIPRFDKGKQMYMSYMRMYFESFAKLYSQRADAIDAVASFNRFIGAIATHPVDPLIPSIRNIVCLLEIWLTISLAIVSKVERRVVVIPASYLAQLNFYDAVCSRRLKAPAVYATISQVTASHATLMKTIIRKLEYMVDLVCARGKFRYFNILGDAFRDEACIRSGEAERSLVFTLVILCNVGLAFSEMDGTYVRQLLHSIPIRSYPPRLAKALESVKSAKGFRDSLVTLQTLLQEREDEFCYQCEWKPYVQFIGGPGLIYSKLNPEKFHNFPYEVLEDAHVPPRPAEEESSEATETDHEDMEISAEVAERVRQSHEQLEEQEKMEKAANKIQEWARQILKKLKLLRAAYVFAQVGYSRRIDYIIRNVTEERVRSQADEILGTPEHWVNDVTLLPYYINENECTICNDVTLQGKARTESYNYVPAPTDAELDETTEPGENFC